MKMKIAAVAAVAVGALSAINAVSPATALAAPPIIECGHVGINAFTGLVNVTTR